MALASRFIEDLGNCCGRRSESKSEDAHKPTEAGGEKRVPEFLPHSPRKLSILSRIEVFSARPAEGASISGRTQKELELTTLIDAGIEKYRRDDFGGALEKFKRASTEVSRLLRHVQQMNMRPSEQAPMTRVLLSFKGRALACIAQVLFRASERSRAVHGGTASSARSRDEASASVRDGMVASREAMRVFMTIGDWEKTEFCLAKMATNVSEAHVEVVLEAYGNVIEKLRKRGTERTVARVRARPPAPSPLRPVAHPSAPPQSKRLRVEMAEIRAASTTGEKA